MTLVRDFERASPWHLLECWGILVAVGDKVAVEVQGEVSLGNLVAHCDGVRNAFNDGLGDFRDVTRSS